MFSQPWLLPGFLLCRPRVFVHREFGTSAAYTDSSSGRRSEGWDVEAVEIKDTQRANFVLNRLSKAGKLREAMQVLDCADNPHIRIHRQTYSALLQVVVVFEGGGGFS